MSHDDQKFLDILEGGIHKLEDDHYEMPLPFKEGKNQVHNNRGQAMVCLDQLRKKMLKNPTFSAKYQEFMSNMLERGFAEKVPIFNVNKNHSVCYITHHGVYSEQKGKLRVVFDASQKSHGVSLNDMLLQGPNLTNSLVGLFIRFRLEPIAFSCDTEKMFYQFHVNPEDLDYLRFFMVG